MQKNNSLNKIHIITLLIPFVILFPNTYKLYFGASSLAFGIMFSAVVIFFVWLYKKERIVFFRKTYFFYIAFIILLQSTIAMYLFDNFNDRKFILSYIFLLIIFISAYYFVRFIQETAPHVLDNILTTILYIVLMDGIISTFRHIYFHAAKRMILFSEPSHFALTVLPLLLYKVLSSKTSYAWFFIGIVFGIALGIKSLTLLVGIFIILFVYSFRKTLLFFTLPIIGIFYFYGIHNLDYFIARISFNDTNNISALVFLSGWDRAYLNFLNTYGLGIGFQQLGYIGSMGVFQNKLASMGLEGLNLYDGGSTASKLISELGILGLVFIFMYIIKVLKLIKTIKINRSIVKTDTQYLFFASIFIMISIDLFIRGVGYFSPNIFLFLAAIIYFTQNKEIDNVL